MKSFILGTFAIDDISLPTIQLKEVVGGAASYAALASSIFTSTGVGGSMGVDFPESFINRLEERMVNTKNIQTSDKPSFRWKALYSPDLNSVETTYQAMNAAAEFDVSRLNDVSKIAKTAFLCNLDPELQMAMIEKIPAHAIKLLDSMDLWIVEKRDVLKKVLKHVDIYFVSEEEAKLLVGQAKPIHELVSEIMSFGPRVVVIKKGRHGLTMYGELGTLSIPSYPLAHVVDPSGAGDSLGGATAGALARLGKFDFPSVATALFLGSVVSSFVVEGFTLDPLFNLSLDVVMNRADLYLRQLPNSEILTLDSV